MPFNFIVGARGTGKTYGSLKYVYEHKIPFLYMRRTQTQADIISKPDFSPYRAYNRDTGKNITIKPVTKYNAAFYDLTGRDPESKDPFPDPIGWTAALSTISNVRGADISDAKIMIYDEFIPERHEKPIKKEGDAFFNSYETINRNRELSGDPPLQVLALANSNDLGNPIFLSLGIVRRAEKLRASGQEIYINHREGIGLFILSKTPISEMKQETALYKLTRGSEFYDMAIENSFNEEKSKIASRPLTEYKPIVSVGEITIYKHKSNGGYYVSEHKTGAPAEFSAGDINLTRFRRIYNYIWIAYIENRVIFESYICEILLNKYFNS